MAFTKLPEEQLFDKLFRYDHDTGKLFWKPETAAIRGFRSAGHEAGWKVFARKSGVVTGIKVGITINGELKYYGAHRLIYNRFVAALGPNDFVDHRDGDPTNNRIGNLRLASPSQNSMNHRVSSSNTSGVSGVYFDSHSGKWRADITVRRKRLSIGRFRDKESAIAARIDAEVRMFGAFAPSLSRAQ